MSCVQHGFSLRESHSRHLRHFGQARPTRRFLADFEVQLCLFVESKRICRAASAGCVGHPAWTMASVPRRWSWFRSSCKKMQSTKLSMSWLNCPTPSSGEFAHANAAEPSIMHHTFWKEFRKKSGEFLARKNCRCISGLLVGV
jgi:hypothetical protein